MARGSTVATRTAKASGAVARTAAEARAWVASARTSAWSSWRSRRVAATPSTARATSPPAPAPMVRAAATRRTSADASSALGPRRRARRRPARRARSAGASARSSAPSGSATSRGQLDQRRRRRPRRRAGRRPSRSRASGSCAVASAAAHGGQRPIDERRRRPRRRDATGASGPRSRRRRRARAGHAPSQDERGDRHAGEHGAVTCTTPGRAAARRERGGAEREVVQAVGPGEQPHPRAVGAGGSTTSATDDDRSPPAVGAGDLHDRSSAELSWSRTAAIGQVEAGREHHHLEPPQGVDGRVGVAGGQRALVARVHRPQHVDRLRPSDLADDDPVGAHAQGVAHQLADRGGARAPSAVAGPRLEPHHVGAGQAELGGVLDGDDALAVGEQGAERVEHGGLAGAGAAAHDHVGPGARPPTRGARRRRAGRARRGGSRRAPNRRIVTHGPSTASGRHDHVHPRPVGQAGVGDRRRAVGPQPEGADDALDEEVDLGAVPGRSASRRSSPEPLDPDRAVPVHHHLGDGVVGEQRLEGPEPGDPGGRRRWRRPWRRRSGAAGGRVAPRASTCGRSAPRSGSVGEQRGVDRRRRGRSVRGGAAQAARARSRARPRGSRVVEQPGVDGAGDLRVDGDLGDDRRADACARRRRGRAPGRARSAARPPTGAAAARGPGAATRKHGRVTKRERVAPAATARATPLGSVPQSATTGRGRRRRGARRARRPRSGSERSRRRGGAGASPSPARTSSRWRASGGTSAPGAPASRRCPGSSGSVSPRAAGTSPARSASSAPSARRAAEEQRRGWRRRRWCPRRPSTTSRRRASVPPRVRPRRGRGGEHRGKPVRAGAAAAVVAADGR